MHEVSIINSVIRTLEDTFPTAKLDTMKTIYLKVGILSNIEPRLLVNAYDSVKIQSRYANIALEIESTPIIIACNKCHHQSQVQDYKFYCAQCKEPCKNLIQGEEMLIHKIEFQD